MKGTPSNAVLLIKVGDEWVQRPLDRTEMNFVLPILQEFDGGTLKVIPAPDGITLAKDCQKMRDKA